MEKKFYIGCVADDFTGAGDVASFFVKAGLVWNEPGIGQHGSG